MKARATPPWPVLQPAPRLWKSAPRTLHTPPQPTGTGVTLTPQQLPPLTHPKTSCRKQMAHGPAPRSTPFYSTQSRGDRSG